MPEDLRQPFLRQPPASFGANRLANLRHDMIEAGAAEFTQTDADLLYAPIAAGGSSGVYTPTLTNVANLDSSAAFECQYLRIGSTVHVTGKVTVDPTDPAVETQLRISLPVASNLGADEDCAGVAFAQGVAGQGAAIIADATNNAALLVFVSVDVSSQSMSFAFSYQVI